MNLPSSARSRLPRVPPWLFAAVVAVHPFAALAQKRGGAAIPDSVVNEAVNSDSFASRPLILILALAAMGLVPFALMMATSFVKISVVLSIVRSALGTQQIPPTQVITGLAIILTVYIMAPVGQQMYRAAGLDIWAKGPGVFSSETVGSMLGAANKSKEPLREWLIKKVTTKDRALFFNLAKKMRKGEDRDAVESNDFMVIIPAFVVSELKEAFQIGFLLFVPFIVIDMVVANILLALGMHMLSPTTISMPFKLLLFVLVDGWYLIAKGLVVGYL
ncbi:MULTISPECIES: type III secretion system export apparatus subunit SctR [Myxococcus]|uniref:EscR/YscR/HrcR family type III secretion system export apparatus protein n=1 Tax=Myxococcus xanthus TaxID=34 RepID=A0A4Y6AIE1_MYXXA|nr:MULTISPECIES: type III secretion system export apparatus subunit SctR [Myxococcus]NOJ53834.1 type III secretion system export apparatus subunit SctR [Myxococcus xanthus]NOJ80710.1 type III secretion system export apparatus subunit SctR [Myxococcus xanthus]NOJ90931.1 type III secretion system export apparatus subunit SctR [Myxococcus xanthus]NOK05722.1 type III secretion system export apparatus subunit SctR [Myxococcus xanthus]QDE67599.1 EscR/YscR/HrcR family type III secretion system export